jgi:hypothetical protein
MRHDLGTRQHLAPPIPKNLLDSAVPLKAGDTKPKSNAQHGQRLGPASIDSVSPTVRVRSPFSGILSGEPTAGHTKTSRPTKWASGPWHCPIACPLIYARSQTANDRQSKLRVRGLPASGGFTLHVAIRAPPLIRTLLRSTRLLARSSTEGCGVIGPSGAEQKDLSSSSKRREIATRKPVLCG